MSRLGQLVSYDDCKECRLCCWFTKYELWETPVISDKKRAFIKEKYPETKFVSKDSYGSLFVMKETSSERKFSDIADSTVFDCPMLDVSGCRLGDDKPFECSIWPYRIMSQDGKLLISVSTLCKPMCENSLESIMAHLKSGLANDISDYAKINPGIIKDYNDGYPILMYI
jgi:Fe-S-cluster containining protein